MKATPIRLGPWRIERTLGRDLSGLYCAARRDGGARATLCLLPGEPTGERLAALMRLIERHRALLHPALIRFRGLDRDGDDRYLIGDPADDALAALRGGHRPAAGQVRALGAAIAAALATAHDAGLVHGGLELDHVLWAPDREPQILGTGIAAIDGDPVGLARGDVAALGRLLCALVIRDDGAVDRATHELVGRLADPSAALSMRDAHDLLAGGDPTRTAHPTGNAGDAPPPRTPGQAGSATASEPAGALARYRILTRLGRGGMGEVLLAQDRVLHRAVAIKRIRPGLEHDPTFRARLRREARVAAGLAHRAIVQVFDLVSDGDTECVVMEYVPGPSLHTLLGGRPMAVAEVVRIAAELADGLAHAHHHGIIHRDLKAENILVGPDRQPKLTDFGIARRAAIAEDSTLRESLTGGRGVVGTLRAMSPEQLQGRELDARSDLFSFGVLLESEARDRTEIELRMQLGPVLITTEGYASRELERSSGRAEALCRRHHDVPLPVRFGLWSVRLMRGSPDQPEIFLGWFREAIERGGPVEAMMAHVAIGVHDHARASYDRAAHHFERAMALFSPTEHAGVVRIYGGCGGFYGHVLNIVVLWKLGRFADAWRHARSTVAQAEALDPYSLAGALTFEMMLHIAVGDAERTEACAERIHEVAGRHGLSYLACWGQCGRGWAAAQRGQAGRAMTELTAGIEGIQRLGVKVWLPYALSLLAEGAIAVGELDRAARALDDALDLCRVSVDRSHEPELLRLRGRLILARDRSAHGAARAAFSDALALARRHGGPAFELRAATDLAALLRDDEPDEAIAVLDPVYRGFADVDDPNLAPARQLLAELAAGTAATASRAGAPPAR